MPENENKKKNKKNKQTVGHEGDSDTNYSLKWSQKGWKKD